jgi:MerR family transcriptional regulator, copper efflux regulator
MGSMTIGQVAKQAGLSVETIRFYERKQLIETPARKESGYRQFAESDIKRLLFIQQAKTLGFSLMEIRELLSIKEDPDTGSRDVKNLAQAKLNDIEKKIEMLQRMKITLKTLVDSCPGEGSKRNCPILEALDATPNE